MKNFMKGVLYFIIGLSIFIISYCGAYTFDKVYETFTAVRNHEEIIKELSKDNKKLNNSFKDSQGELFVLMGKFHVLRLNYDYIMSKLKAELELTKEEFLKAQAQYPIYEDLKNITVYMIQEQEDGGASGTGVIVSKQGLDTYILTNKHVCSNENIDHCFVEIYKNNDFIKLPLTFVKQDKIYDLALWKTNEFLPNKTTIQGLGTAIPQDKVYSVGNYLGLRSIYTEGTFSGYLDNDIMLNLPCVYGCSGSGVFNREGKLIGLVRAVPRVGIFQVDTNKAICVSYENIKTFLEGYL